MTFEVVGPIWPQNTLGHPADEVTYIVVVFFPRMGGARRGEDGRGRPPEVHIARPRTGLLGATVCERPGLMPRSKGVVVIVSQPADTRLLRKVGDPCVFSRQLEDT